MASRLARPPMWFWIVAGLLVLWSLFGCFAYYSQVTMSAADMARLPQAEQDIWGSAPAWVTGAYAIAVFVGLAAGAALLARKSIARALFGVSLIAILVQFGWVFLATPILKTVGPSSAGLPAVIIVVASFMLWFSGAAAKRGWIG